MYKHYYINNNQTLNPGLHHEVHTKEHAAQLGIRSTQYVGIFASEVEGVAQAKKIYFDADGCATCCPKHIGGNQYGTFFSSCRSQSQRRLGCEA